MDELEKLVEINKNYRKFIQYQNTVSFALDYYTKEIDKILNGNSMLFLFRLKKLHFYMDERKRIVKIYTAMEYWFWLWRDIANKEVGDDL